MGDLRVSVDGYRLLGGFGFSVLPVFLLLLPRFFFFFFYDLVLSGLRNGFGG